VEELIRELIEAGQRTFPWADIKDRDVAVVQAGHVPGAPNHEPIYRSRLIPHSDPRLVSILTAKYTTARAAAEAVVNRIGHALSIAVAPSVSARRDLVMARPLEGPLEDRIRWAQETEMAPGRSDALRGRLIEGALGITLDAAPPEA
jgi:glycerol-3-phosphate dehydrogenase